MTLAEARIGYGKKWWPTVNALEATEIARVCQAVEQFTKDPNHPGLNLHPLGGDSTKDLHTIRASRDVRILLAKRGSTYLMLEAGHHDDVYARAPRLEFVTNPHTGFLDVIERPLPTSGDDSTTSVPTRSRAIADDSPRPLDHWTGAELAETGCTTDDVALIRACRTEDDILELPTHLFELVLEIMELTPEQWRSPSMSPEADAEERLRTSIARDGALAGFTKLLTPEQAVAVASAPIEDWMVFLHPDQRDAVTRTYEGPARVRGSAGTGKTVVGLHRAAELADRYRSDGQQILFTTFIKSLPPVFEHLYERIPGTRADDVRFVNVDKLASDICREAGDHTTSVDSKSVDAAFASAWKSVVTSASPITKARLTRQYLREEVTAVIKGRGLDSLADYLEIERTGRSTPFGRALREQAWELRQAWDEQMAQRGTVDFPDRLRRARDIARAMPSHYRAAIVDEAQDITLVGLQFVRALVNGNDGADRRDNVLIVGDGAQRIYPGGYTLRQAGVEVRGRTTVLRVNYRNTREVIDAAMAVTGGGQVDDLGDAYRRDEERADSGREGVSPRLVLAGSSDAETEFIAREIDHLIGDEALDHGDIAVAVATNNQAKALYDALRGHGIPCQRLEDYDGIPAPLVKVGTHHRIKGLEFKVVFLPGLSRHQFPRPATKGQDPDEYAEQCERSISQLFVAMTRARDLLYVVSTGDPTESITNAIDRFETVSVDA